jgi:hypothetical protein
MSNSERVQDQHKNTIQCFRITGPLGYDALNPHCGAVDSIPSVGVPSIFLNLLATERIFSYYRFILLLR